MERMTIEVKENENRIRITLHDHTFVEVRRSTGEWVETQRTDAEEVFVGLSPGSYVVESDGTIRSVKTEHVEIELP